MTATADRINRRARFVTPKSSMFDTKLKKIGSVAQTACQGRFSNPEVASILEITFPRGKMAQFYGHTGLQWWLSDPDRLRKRPRVKAGEITALSLRGNRMGVNRQSSRHHTYSWQAGFRQIDRGRPRSE